MPISAWGGAPKLDWVFVGIISVIFCVEIVELGLYGFDMIVKVGVVVIVWGGGCCGDDGCCKKK